MLEGLLREPFEAYFVTPVITLMGERFTPHYLTLMAVLSGLLTAFFIYLDAIWPAAIFLLLSGYLDVLDGALARHLNQSSSLGSVFDIVGDRLVEFLICVGLWAHSPLMRGGFVIFMLGAILVCVTSFLVVGIFSDNQGKKSFHYSAGLMERAEAFIFFLLMILLPSLFWVFASLFGLLTFYTAFKRVYDFSLQASEG